MQVKRLWIGATLGVCATLSLLSFTSQPAISAEATTLADRVTDAVTKAGTPAHLTGRITSDGKVEIDSTRPSGAITARGRTVRLTLDSSVKTRSEPVGSDWAYGDVAHDTDSMVRASSGGGLQILTVMRTASAPSQQRYRLELAAGVSVVAADGGFALTDGNAIVGAIESPWARDATGRNLPTRYTVDGNVLTQTTDTSGAQFPVVADPKITFGWSVYLGMFGYEIRAAGVAIAAIGGAAVIVSCTLIGNIPNAFLRSLASIACGAVALNLTTLFRLIYQVAQSSPTDGLCYQFNLSNMTGPVVVSSNNCQ